MACQLTTDKYIKIVLDLLTLNPSKFNQFDNTAQWLLSQDLTPESKALSLHSLAHIYQRMSEIDASFYQAGKASQVIDAGTLLSDLPAYLKGIQEIYPAARSARSTTLQDVEKAIDALGNKNFVAPTDLNGPSGALTLASNYLRSTSFESPEAKQEQATAFRTAIEAQLKSIPAINTLYRDNILMRQVDRALSNQVVPSQYVSLKDIADLATLRTFMVTLTNGQQMEGMQDETGILRTLAPDGSLEIIPQDLIASSVEMNVGSSFRSSNWEQVFYDETFYSNFVIKALDGTGQQALMDRLQSMAAPQSAIRIVAVRTSTAADERVARIKEVAERNPELASLANRNHETFESDAQVNYLKENPTATVLSVSRPKASEQTFVLMGEVIGTGERFFLYGLNNSAFVHGDNRTEMVDFTNPRHLQQVKELSLKNTADGKVSLNDKDLERLKDAHQKYQDFQQTVSDAVQEAFLRGETALDVTDAFFDQYEVTSRHSNKRAVRFADEVSNYPQIARTLTVVTRVAGKVVSKEVRTVPFVFLRQGNSEVWKLAPTIAHNELIEVEEGREPISQLDYLASEIGFRIEDINNLLRPTDKKQTHIVLHFNKDNSISYRPVQRSKFAEDHAFFANYIVELAEALGSEERLSAVRAFEDKYTFGLANAANSKNAPFSLKFDISPKGNLQIVMSPRSETFDTTYENLMFQETETGERKLKNQFKFAVPERILMDMAKAFRGEGKLMQVVLEEYPFLKSFDLSKAADRTQFYDKLQDLANEKDASGALLQLMQKIEETQSNFAKVLINSVVEQLQARTTEIPGFMDQLKKDFTWNGKFRSEFLVADLTSENRMIPRLVHSKRTANEAFGADTRRLKILTKDQQRRLAIVSKRTPVSTTMAAAPESAPIVTAPVSKTDAAPALQNPDTKAAQAGLKTPKKGATRLFSMADTVQEVETETTAQRQQAADWLRNTLPQFEISPEFVEDMLSLSGMDGTVLGMFKDRVIYLNNQIKSKGVIYHEAFHGVFRYLMGQESRTSLIKSITDQKKYASKFTDAALQEFARQRGYVFNKEAMRRLQAEEILADGFQQYMNTKTEPKGVLGRFMQMLKKLLDFFNKNQRFIDRTYKEIESGQYKSASVQSGLFDGQQVYEMVPGLITIQANEAGTQAEPFQNTLKSKKDQDRLINMLTSYVVEDSTSDSFENKFERASKELLDNVFNLDKFLATVAKDKQERVLQKIGETWKNYRFMLGARFRGETLYDVNRTGLKDLDEEFYENLYQDPVTGELKDNSMGDVSYALLRDLVEDRVRSLNNLLDQNPTMDELIDELNGEHENRADDPDKEAAEEVPSENYDALGETNRLDSIPREVRKFLAVTRYQRMDAELGIAFPDVVNAENIYQTLMQVSAEMDPRHIVSNIATTARLMIRDGYTEQGEELMQVYNKIQDYTMLDENGLPRTNQQLFYMIIDTLHGTEIDYVMFNINGRIEEIDRDETMFVPTSYTMKDRVGFEDANRKLRDVISGMILKAQQAIGDPEKAQALQNNAKRLQQLANEVVTSNALLSDRTNEKLESKGRVLQQAMEAVGIKLPLSLVQLSLVAIDKKDNMLELPNLSGELLEHYENNKNFVREGKYLTRDFFKFMGAIYEAVAKKSVSLENFTTVMDKPASTNKNVNGMTSALRKAMTYVTKYDPTSLPSTVRNAEGKPIYRYIKYTPHMTILQDIRQKGLEGALAEDPFYEGYLKAFFLDNPMFGDLLSGKDTDTSRKVKLFLDNMSISLFGGVQQQLNGMYKDGSGFKDIDEASLYLLNLVSFMNRKTHTAVNAVQKEDGTYEEQVTQITTFNRSYSQLESSPTNLLVSGLYENYTDKNQDSGLARTKDGVLKIVDTLEQTIQQEYNRIQREWSERLTRKQAYDERQENNLLLNYNGKLSKDNIKTADTSDPSLRAYNFMKLEDFFMQYPEFKSTDDQTGLADLAKAGLSYENLDPATRTELRKALNNYAIDQLKKHIGRLEQTGAIKKMEQPVFTTQTDKEGKIVGYTATKNTIPYYISELIPTRLRVNDVMEENDVLEQYKKTRTSIVDKTGRKSQNTNVALLVSDAFFNFWSNSLQFNEIFDGDMAMNVNNSVDYVKRAKRFLASGSTMKEGQHRVAYVNTIKEYIHPVLRQYGPYNTIQEIENDDRITNESHRNTLIRDFKLNEKVFDGQSVSTIMHQMDMFETFGRLSPEIQDLLIAKHYRPLTAEELDLMKKRMVVMNPKKTVSASRSSYHKQSENYLDRNDVSVLVIPEGRTRKEVYNQLHGIYNNIYSLRKQRQQHLLDNEQALAAEVEKDIRMLVETAHQFYQPMPHRTKLHALLNSMEYYQIDQMMDTEASKNTTVLPVDFNAEFNSNPGGYVNLGFTSMEMQNKFKYLQVETSGVKDKSKFSVQSKVLLLADLDALDRIARLNGRTPSASEEAALLEIDRIALQYKNTLRDVGKANMAYLQNILRKGTDMDLGRIFDLIRESLTEQGAPETIVNFFQTGADGQPVHSPNLPGVRSMLEYYIFGEYSKHVTDEKGAGFKNIHVSPWGQDVLVDTQTGEVIPTHEYRKNPKAYENRVSSRPLGVSVEDEKDASGNPTGRKIYYVEAIVPMPNFGGNKEMEAFYMRNLTKMFGVRIPTEDKRSMVAIKAVDFMDAANMNGIVLPYLAHILAGSDFDVDALYGQIKAYYEDFAQNPHVYGSYENFRTPQTGQFLEFLSFLSDDKEFSMLIGKEKETLAAQEGFGPGNMEPTPEAWAIARAYGFTDEDYAYLLSDNEVREYLKQYRSEVKDLNQQKAETYNSFIDSINRLKANKDDAAAREDRKRFGARMAELKEEYEPSKSNLERLTDIQKRNRQLAKVLINAQATVNVFARMALPFTQDMFEANPAYAQMVRPVYQNQNLDAKLAIMSNEAVFNNIYISEASSTERLEQIMDRFGIKLKDFMGRYNIFTIDGVINAKVTTAMNKDGIGISANMNKFLALASSIAMEISAENVVWKYNRTNILEDGRTQFTAVNKNKFGELNDEDVRAIALVGNILGMFADGAKKPIPGALNMNVENASIIMAMLGIGLSPEFAMSFNFLPEVRKAIRRVEGSKRALNADSTTNMRFLSNELAAEISALSNDNPNSLERLVQLGVLDAGSSPYNMSINKDLLVLDFSPKELDMDAMAADRLTTVDIGYDVSVKVTDPKIKDAFTKEPLTEAERRMLLLALYREQAMQASVLQRSGSIINLFKKLNPTTAAFDRLYNNIQELKTGSIFTQESVDRLFSDDQIWPVLSEAMDDLHTQLGNTFIERTRFFQPFRTVFGSIMNDPANIAKAVTAYVSLRKYLRDMPGSRLSDNEAENAYFGKDDAKLAEVFSADYWFTNNLPERLETLRKQYPDNKFLQLLRPEYSGKSVRRVDGSIAQERNLTMVAKVKPNGKLFQDIVDDAEVLKREQYLFMKELFYHELVRTALQYKKGSFLQFLGSDLQKPLSQYINEFVEITRTSSDMVEAFRKFMGQESMTNEEAYNNASEIVAMIASLAVNEKDNRRIPIASTISVGKKSGVFAIAKEALPDASDQAVMQAGKALVNDIFGKELMGEKSGNSLAPYALTDQEITVNLNTIMSNEVRQKAGKLIAKKLGIQYMRNNDQFRFPFVIKIGSSAYILQGVDDLDRQTTFTEQILNGTTVNNIGMSARYRILPVNKMEDRTINSIALPKEELQRYNAYQAGKRTLNAVAPVKATVVEKQATVLTEEPVPVKDNQTAAVRLSTPENPIQVYSDGSDFKGSGKIGFGAVFQHGGKAYELSGTEASSEVKRLKELHPDSKFSNPTMEILALVATLNSFKTKGEHLVINQDYTGAVNYDGLWQHAEGSAQRAVKPWKAKEPYIQTLVNSAIKLIDQIQKNGGSVRIQWVKGHSGNPMNDAADAAAKNREVFNTFADAYSGQSTQAAQPDVDSLNLTPDAMKALYERSTKKKTYESFSKAAQEYIANNRGTLSNEQIIEDLTCL